MADAPAFSWVAVVEFLRAIAILLLVSHVEMHCIPQGDFVEGAEIANSDDGHAHRRMFFGVAVFNAKPRLACMCPGWYVTSLNAAQQRVNRWAPSGLG